MSYTPSFLINHQQLMKYHSDNENIFEWQYFPYEKDSPMKIISDSFPFSKQFGSLVSIRDVDFAYLPTEYSYEKNSLIEFLTKNNIEHYIFGS